MALKEYAGGAAPTTLSSTINNSAASCAGADLTNYPTGATGDFWIVIDPGLSNEEKILCDSRTGNTINFAASGRGGDGTTATTHTAGAEIQHIFTAEDAREANAHVFNTALDQHSQYLNTARHDVTARHTFGSVIPAATSVSDLSGDSDAGSGGAGSYGNHKHAFPVWTSYAPTLTGLTVGGGTLTGRYLRSGKLLLGLQINYAAGAGATFSGPFEFSLPSGLSSANICLGLVRVQQGGTTINGQALIFGSSIFPASPSTATPPMSSLAPTHPTAWANGHSIIITAANIELS